MKTPEQQNNSESRTVIRGESTQKVLLEGGKSNESIKLIRGHDGYLTVQYQTEPIESANSKVAFIDWLGFTVRTLSLGELRKVLIEIFNLKELEWTQTDKGWSGYKHKIELGHYGWLAHGGKSQKETVNIQLRPAACIQFKNLNSIVEWSKQHNAKITRCDVAHDDYEGELINIEQARKWNDEGGYTTNGRKPKPREIINHDKTVGNTFYIGKRENGKMLRIYEKGKEQGDPKSTWNRVEVEFRSKDRDIPWDILKQPGKYLAGAYPCLSYLSKKQNHIRTVKKSYNISYNHMVSWLRRSGGKALNAMLIRERGDISKVISEIQREGIPNRLEPYYECIKKEISAYV
jgi:DNA relaxase NicK